MKAYIENNYKIVHEKEEFLTIKAKNNNNDLFDFVLCRKDGTYKDGRHPEKVIMGNIYDDLGRRDFTMNSIAINEAGDYIDPFNGVDDIINKKIRCVGVTENRFNEDTLRLLRAFRFHITLGFDLDEEIINCLNNEKMINKLSTISTERIKQETSKVFAFDTLKTIKKINEYPILMNYLFTNVLTLKPMLIQN